MVHGLIGKKLGMTQVFDEGGNVIPVTVVQAGPCVVVQKKMSDSDGYEAVQLGLVEPKRYQANKPTEGHFGKAGVPPTRILKEFSFDEDEDDKVSVGDQVLVGDIFSERESVSVTGRSKGRGFQGVMKRHGYSGGRATHGSMFHRAPGSIGASASPSRVYPGTKLPGQMGDVNVTTRRLRIVKIDEENNIMLIKGAVPGSSGGYLVVRKSRL